jgi:hypothetical protein
VEHKVEVLSHEVVAWMEKEQASETL